MIERTAFGATAPHAADQSRLQRNGSGEGAAVPRQPLTIQAPADGSPAGAAGTVVHQIDGRVRLRLPRLRSDSAFAERAVAWLTKQPGIPSARVNAACASLVVRYDPALLTAAQVCAWLEQPLPEAEGPAARPAPVEPRLTALLCGGAALGLSLLGAPAVLSAGLLAVGAAPVFLRAGRSLMTEGRLTVDALDASAISAVALRGDLVAAALTASLIAGGEYVRDLTARRSREAVVDLLASTGRHAWVVRGRRKERVPAETVAVGDTVVVYPGELVPVDGVVVRGNAFVDQKVLTGEASPVPKKAGQAVYAATVLTEGKVYVRTERVGSATRASHIVQMLEAAPVHDTRLANYAERFANRLVVPTFVLAGGLYALTGDVGRVASVLIFDFATGIRVSAPTAVLASMLSAARRDVLIKGGRALERLARVDTLVFDKTGTLTTGEPVLVDFRSLDLAVRREEVLALAAAAERRLTHPAAQVIVRAAEIRQLAIPERGESHYAVGLGVAADVEGRQIVVGSARYLARQGVALSAEARRVADAAGGRGASTVFVARDRELIGLLSYADVARPEARAVLDQLRARGLRDIVMVTGDHVRVAWGIAHALGIERVEAEVFPERKAEIVRELQAAGHVVGVIGDGINDSPALAYADVACALKAGSDVARETADVVLHGDLHGLPEAIDIARASAALIQENLALVAVPNAIGLALASAGLVGPVTSTMLNNGSSVAAAVNSLRPLLTGSGAPTGRAQST